MSANSGPGTVRPGGSRHRVAPTAQALNSSDTNASKLSDANCSTTLSAVSPYIARWAWARFTAFRCSTTTPLGRPVEPEV